MMMNLLPKSKYCFDTSAFIDSWRRFYTPSIFPTLWEQLSELMKSGQIVVPKEAEKEIVAGNDELKTWFKFSNSCVRAYTLAQLKIVTEIVNKYPKVSQYNKIKPIHADPFVVALAKIENATVVTWEGSNGSKDNPRIPDLCKEFEVECCNMIGFFEKEGWSFKH